MKALLIPCAALLATGVASAQSSVTLFGVVDAAINRTTNTSRDALGNEATVSRTALNNSGYNTSRIGFRGVEDLGGGLSAGFWLESVLTNDDGASAMAFTRRSTVSLAGNFGEIRLGRDYTPTFNNDSLSDPFGTVGLGSSLLVTAQNFNTAGGAGGFGGNPNYIRASNSASYFLPSGLGGFYGQVMYAFHEQVKYEDGAAVPPGASLRAGRYAGGRVGYASGGLNVAIAYGESISADNFIAGTTDKVKTANIGASYDLGFLKMFGGLSRATKARDYALVPVTGGTPDTDLNGYVLGVNVPVGVGLIRASYSHVKYDMKDSQVATPEASKLALGYVHNLSKRTALFTTVGRVSNKHGAALTLGGPTYVSNATFVPRSSIGYDIGIRHAF